MIRFSLKCDKDHDFDSWFPSGAAFDVLKAGGHVTCPVCGSAAVEKALMAPAVQAARATEAPLRSAETPMEQAIAALKKQIAENSEYVGMNFAAEARRIHEGDAPERSIHGEARPDEARKLIEEGVPVAPLPFLPARKAN